MFFARINEVFGQLVNLIAEVIKSIRFFLIFFVIWILVFSWLYRIAGVELNETNNYPHVPYFVSYFLEAFRNTLGDF